MRAAHLPSVVRWPVLALLAVPAVGVALAITFAADHSPRFGFIVLGAFGIGTAIAGALGAALLPAGGLRTRAVIRAALAAIAGAVSLSALGWAVGASVDPVTSAAVLSWVIAGSLIALALVDVSIWRRLRGTDRSARDWLISAIILAVGGLAPLLVPANYLLPYVVRDQDIVLPLELTASIVMIGITGAILAILGVVLVIGAISLIPPRPRPVAAGDAPDAAVHA